MNAWELASRSEKGSPLLCLLLIIKLRKLPGWTPRAFFLPSAASACTETAGLCCFTPPATPMNIFNVCHFALRTQPALKVRVT